MNILDEVKMNTTNCKKKLKNVIFWQKYLYFRHFELRYIYLYIKIVKDIRFPDIIK